MRSRPGAALIRHKDARAGRRTLRQRMTSQSPACRSRHERTPRRTRGQRRHQLLGRLVHHLSQGRVDLLRGSRSRGGGRRSDRQPCMLGCCALVAPTRAAPHVRAVQAAQGLDACRGPPAGLPAEPRRAAYLEEEHAQAHRPRRQRHREPTVLERLRLACGAGGRGQLAAGRVRCAAGAQRAAGLARCWVLRGCSLRRKAGSGGGAAVAGAPCVCKEPRAPGPSILKYWRMACTALVSRPCWRNFCAMSSYTAASRRGSDCCASDTAGRHKGRQVVEGRRGALLGSGRGSGRSAACCCAWARFASRPPSASSPGPGCPGSADVQQC